MDTKKYMKRDVFVRNEKIDKFKIGILKIGGKNLWRKSYYER